jgi:hypothetical protein
MHNILCKIALYIIIILLGDYRILNANPLQVKSVKYTDEEINTNAKKTATFESFFAKPKSLYLGDLVYVNPMIVNNFRDYKSRLSMYVDIYGSPNIALQTKTISGGTILPTQVLGSVGASFGFDMVIHGFYFSAGVGEYNLISGDGKVTYGYKFQFRIGGEIDIPQMPLTKIYFIYRDNQLQMSNVNLSGDNYFGYYSRNIGVGFSVNVFKGIDIGMDICYSLLHAGTVGTGAAGANSSSGPTADYPLIMPQVFVKFNF